MIRTVLTLHPKSGENKRLIGFFSERRILERAVEFEGCLSVELQVPEPDVGKVLVTALWDSLENYNIYLNSTGREQDVKQMKELLADPEQEIGTACLYKVYAYVSQATPHTA